MPLLDCEADTHPKQHGISIVRRCKIEVGDSDGGETKMSRKRPFARDERACAQCQGPCPRRWSRSLRAVRSVAVLHTPVCALPTAVVRSQTAAESVRVGQCCVPRALPAPFRLVSGADIKEDLGRACPLSRAARAALNIHAAPCQRC